VTETTPIDTAHAAMEAAPDDDAARLRFYERLADSELYLMLKEEARDDTVTPDLFELPEATFALVFDREDRLSQFAGQAVPYAAISGRAIAAMLAGQGVGLGLNLDVAPSAILIPPAAVDWLAQTLLAAPDEVEERIAEFTRPGNLPETLLTALDTKLAMTAGLARQAYLIGTTSESGTKGHLLAFVDAKDDARAPLAKAVGEALTFSGLDAGVLDVGFFDAHDPAAAALARHGLRFDLPEPPQPRKVEHITPGSDPDNPPKLR